MHTCVNMYIYECRRPQVLQASNASEPELQALTGLLTWVLGMKLRSSARAVCLSLATEPSILRVQPRITFLGHQPFVRWLLYCFPSHQVLYRVHFFSILNSCCRQTSDYNYPVVCCPCGWSCQWLMTLSLLADTFPTCHLPYLLIWLFKASFYLKGLPTLPIAELQECFAYWEHFPHQMWFWEYSPSCRWSLFLEDAGGPKLYIWMVLNWSPCLSPVLLVS